MLSILIPVYNFEVELLVRDLHQQARATAQVFEIILLDDHSDKAFHEKNSLLSKLEYVRYERLPQNVGRSCIRNLLAHKANYEFLLFMDCDSKVVKKDYLAQYFQHLDANTILYGGRTYQKEPTQKEELRLHWFVGKAREEKAAADRQQQPWHSFMTNNYLIPKAIQLQFPFEERLNQYGHEDTLFGLQLKAAKHSILHLDNPLEHIGLETAQEFLAKSEKAIKNLIFLSQEFPQMETKLWNTAMRLHRWKMDRLFLRLFKRRREKWERNLHSSIPDLSLFDFWKLGILLGHLLEKKPSNKAIQQ